MSRIKTVADLIAELEELPPEMPIMAQHQPSWPLREFIGGIWVEDGTSDEEEDLECEECGRLTLSQPIEDKEALLDKNAWYRSCFYCNHIQECQPPMPEENKVAYIVLSGQPRDGTPYGSKRAWSNL